MIPSRRSSFLLRAAVLLVVFVATGGASPGHIRGCDAPDAGTADFNTFCRDFENRVCARNNALMPDESRLSMCVSMIDARCAGRNWIPGTEPTQDQANACLGAMVQVEYIATPPCEIPQCTGLVPCGMGGGIDPEGI